MTLRTGSDQVFVLSGSNEVFTGLAGDSVSLQGGTNVIDTNLGLSSFYSMAIILSIQVPVMTLSPSAEELTQLFQERVMI